MNPTAAKCWSVVLIAVAIVPCVVEAQMKWTPEITTKQGKLQLAGKDIVFATGYPVKTESVTTLVDRVDTLVNDVADVRAAALSASTVDSKVAAAIAASESRTDEKISASGYSFGDIDGKVSGLNGKISSLDSSNKAVTNALKQELAATNKKLAIATSEVTALKATVDSKVAAAITASEARTDKKISASTNCDGYGLTAEKPALNCKHILDTCPGASTGEYHVTMNGQYGGSGIVARCDMKTDDGGWTLFGTKKTHNAKTIPEKTSNIKVQCYKSTGQDCKGLIPQKAVWKEVMFRFDRYDNSETTGKELGNGKALTFLVWRKGLTNRGSKDMNKLFEEMFIYGHRNRGDPGGRRVCGFSKSTKEKDGGERRSESYHCVDLMHFHNGGTISERHQGSSGGSDQWIDMWDSVDSNGNDYEKVNALGGNPRGEKCIAGVCHFKDPINLYFR